MTAGFALGRHFPARLVPAYWAAQLLGACVAALVLRASLGDVGGLGATTPSGSAGQAFLWEVVLTVFLMLVILAVATDTRAVSQLAALAIGGTVALDALFGGPVTGASMNPARSLAPAIAGGPTDGALDVPRGTGRGAALAVGLYAYLAAERGRSDRRHAGGLRIGNGRPPPARAVGHAPRGRSASAVCSRIARDHRLPVGALDAVPGALERQQSRARDLLGQRLAVLEREHRIGGAVDRRASAPRSRTSARRRRSPSGIRAVVLRRRDVPRALDVAVDELAGQAASSNGRSPPASMRA